jgi:hypothetical protein
MPIIGKRCYTHVLIVDKLQRRHTLIDLHATEIDVNRRLANTRSAQSRPFIRSILARIAPAMCIIVIAVCSTSCCCSDTNSSRIYYLIKFNCYSVPINRYLLFEVRQSVDKYKG